MSLVSGKNMVLYIYSGAWKPFVCARSMSKTESTSYIKTSVSGSGKDETIVPAENSATATADGVISLNDASALTIADLRTLQRSHTKLLCRFERIAEDSTVWTEEEYYYIINSTDTGSFDGVGTFSIEMRRSGSTTVVYTPTSTSNLNKVKRYPAIGDSLNMTGGETSFESALLLDKDILEIVKDGLGQAKIILSGTPVGKEALYIPIDSGVGRVEFAVQFEVGEEGYVLYQDK